MGAKTKLLTVIFLLVGSLVVGIRHVHGELPTTCPVIQQALSDYGHIKVGITREEVEKYFARRGGAQFPDNTGYVHPKCAFIHVDIEFEANGPVERLFSLDDRVTKVSKLYVDYPPKD